MKKVFLLFALLMILLLSACNSENVPTDDGNSASSANFEQQETETASDSADDISAFLDGSKSFIDARTGKTCTVFTLPEVNDYYLGKENRYACADLDSDGKNEILVEYDVGGDTAILHESEGVWKAYHMVFRARKDLRTDGEMMWSAGAEYSGTHRVEFSDGELKTKILLDSDFEKDVHYYAGEEISSDASMKEWDKFEDKKKVDWFNIYPVFES